MLHGCMKQSDRGEEGRGGKEEGIASRVGFSAGAAAVIDIYYGSGTDYVGQESKEQQIRERAATEMPVPGGRWQRCRHREQAQRATIAP